MDGYLGRDDTPSGASRRREGAFFFLGLLALLVIGFTLQGELGIPFDTTLRVACAALCLAFIYKLGADYPGEKWPRISLWLAFLVNVAIFFTPLVHRPASRGELMLFALPDAIVVLTARVVTYRAGDVHQRATRQTMILGLLVATVFCVGVLGLTWAQTRTAHAHSVSN